MAYKLGFLLSLIFLIPLFIMFGDMISIQSIYTNLDAVSVTAGYVISSYGGITDSVIELVQNEANARIEPISTGAPSFGSIFEYKISSIYDPMIISNEPMEISLVRSVIIGYMTA